MSVPGLRRVLTLAATSMSPEFASALYELLLGVPVLVPWAATTPRLVRGPAGDLALPIFLDDAALLRWAGEATPSHRCSTQEAAQLALSVPEALLVIDLGSSPGSQPIARRGVELLAQATYPGADAYHGGCGYAQRLAHAVREGSIPDTLLKEAAEVRVFAIGHLDRGPSMGDGVFEVSAMQVLSARHADGSPYCIAWPTPGPSFAFMPDAPNRMTLTVDRLVEMALQTGRGFALAPESPYGVGISSELLARLWRPR